MLKQVLYTIVAVIIFTPATAQEVNEKNAALDQISKEYFFNSNEYFILADALIDGTLLESAPYELVYKTGMLSVNGHALSEPLQSKYIDKIKHHFDRLNVPEAYQKLNFKGDRLDINTLHAHNYRRYMPSNNTYNPNKYEAPVCPTGMSLELLNALEAKYVTTHKDDSTLIHVLVSDKIIKKATKVHIRYGKNECWVNGVQVTQNPDKYVALAKKINANIVHDDSEFYGLNYDTYEVNRFGFCDNKN